MDPTWSTLVTACDGTGVERTWHVLDSGVRDEGNTRGTLLCVHGNPNWSYMWRGLARSLTDWRVIAVDALNMGFSERTGTPKRLADHIADLDALTRSLNIDGPVVTVAHDWGGPVSMGWAHSNVEKVAGVVLMNTGVARPAATKVPPLISAARSMVRVTCERTPMFLHGALRMARPQLQRDVYRAYAAPYGSPELRTGIRDFVEDIPIEETHPSFDTLASVASGMDKLRHVPSLLLWGSKDIIFSDAFLHDLMQRLPHADVHRYGDAGHQIIEDTDAVAVISSWLDRLKPGPLPHTQPVSGQTVSGQTGSGQAGDSDSLWAAIEARRGDTAAAIVEMDSKDAATIARSISFDELEQQVRAAAKSLIAAGVRKGDRLATLIPPGIDLTVLVYGCLRAGITVVAPDAALGVSGMRRALRSSRPDYVVGDWRAMLFARGLRLPATLLSITKLHERMAQTSGDRHHELPSEPAPDDPAALVFTSGSTGPSKGVVYTHGQLQAQRDAIIHAFSIEPSDRLVVAFAPFAVLAPAIGITSVVPPMDVTAPAKLRAVTLAGAANAVDATMVFASPAVLANIAATATELDIAGRGALQRVRTVATAGAPVSPRLLAAVEPVFPNAKLYTPYGMTEAMPVTIASADEIEAAGTDRGVCVGRPLPSVDVEIRPIGNVDTPGAGELGEICVRASHAASGYDRLWAQQQRAFKAGWHLTGDVGHLDIHGRLWIEGRVDHLIHRPTGMLAPVGTELQAESVAGVERAAAVGIGPIGIQQLAVVVSGDSLGSGPRGSDIVANADLAAAVRAAVSEEVAAVLVAPNIPVDRRHNSKVDRTRVQRWAQAVLSGSRAGSSPMRMGLRRGRL